MGIRVPSCFLCLLLVSTAKICGLVFTVVKGLREPKLFQIDFSLKKKQGAADRQTKAHPARFFMYRKVFRQEERHFAHEGGHVTEVVKDYVGHACGQQESRRGTSTVPVPPPRARAARGRAARARTPSGKTKL